MKFIHTSDLHYGGVRCREEKRNEPRSIALADAEFVIVTGDLTENGFDGSLLCCIEYGGDDYQLQRFKLKFIRPIERSGKSIYLCPGNHDLGYWWSPYKPVMHYIRKRHKSTQYAFERNGLRFICCGIYPKDLKWLKKQMRQDQPHVIFFHYNLIGKWSDWWSEKEKTAFAKVIEPYHIVAILVGHSHISEIQNWRGYRVILSGDQYSIITYDEAAKQITEVDYVYI